MGKLSEILPKQFFVEALGENPNENDFSRLLCACFSVSPVFAREVLGCIWPKRVFQKKPPSTANGWSCVDQTSAPQAGGGRPDLRFWCAANGRTKNHDSFIWVESKIESRLGVQQLRKYLDAKAKPLVVLTKNRPEVLRSELDKHQITAVRWQELCRVLRQVPCKGKDEFVCRSFASFLEESGMAYRDDVTPDHLDRLRITFAKLRQVTHHGMVLHGAFRTADDCLDLLREVKIQLREKSSKLERWKSWGPGYWYSGDANSEHVLSFGLYPKRYNDCAINIGLSFRPEKQDVVIRLSYWNNPKGINETVRTAPISKVISRGRLDAHKLAGVAFSFASSRKIT